MGIKNIIDKYLKSGKKSSPFFDKFVARMMKPAMSRKEREQLFAEIARYDMSDVMSHRESVAFEKWWKGERDWYKILDDDKHYKEVAKKRMAAGRGDVPIR